ncbi:signal peptidase II [bacterium]|nr:signal peptidase II [bacterium]
MNRSPQAWLPLILTGVVIILDRLTKQIVDKTMDLGDSIPFLGDAVRWTYVHNYGMAFGMKLTGGVVLGYISILAVFVILFVLLRTPPKDVPTRWILAAILGGAIGNTYDRLVYGYVIDFIDVNLPDFLMDRWPVFNIADSAVSVGVVLLILMMLFIKHPKEEEAEATDGNVEVNMPDSLVSADGMTLTDAPRFDSGVAEYAVAEEARRVGEADKSDEGEPGDDPEPEQDDDREVRS